ncbi:hypothetical protein [Halodesulfovibrio aestuarii]|uniref:hypothetical protein n=1 Tax=Halodesulfovibrio aestuarii TaxID=126333 RepID=UPI0012DEA224|nr:hypothetical protein [Halodesulfovibrio aestuarii]
MPRQGLKEEGTMLARRSGENLNSRAWYLRLCHLSRVRNGVFRNVTGAGEQP